MFRLFTTPVWFNGWDVMFDMVSLVVALLIAAYSFRLYRINNQNKFAYFSLAFVMVAVSLFSKIFTDSVLYYTPLRDVTAVVLQPLAGPGLQFSALLYRAAFFLQMAPLLGAWLLIFFISQKSRDRLHRFYELSQIGLFVYLVLLVSFVSNFRYFVFYLTSAVLLALIVLNYYKNYLNTDKNKNAKMVMISFVFILLAQFFFIFVFMVPGLYVIGELLMLIGFLLILYAYGRVTRT
ncbi:hypothetical protein COV20_01935 [Candidatus Woesearchaeota archaeon CG10_big_fil_rev_8_21_14_0_10_45_16]|nr:MAG: hypothetical protein COV20_01935 [Candidatus Woesearchaeota archaeon CG10_big_fil_rev_8_21_14_0_10_45_16]